jgi:hypothetical protein
MFDRIRLHGGLHPSGVKASILWGYRQAAVLGRWSITKESKGKWLLTATVERADAFQCRQKPLIFTAPRHKGMWCWDVESLHVGPNQIRATLGQLLY